MESTAHRSDLRVVAPSLKISFVQQFGAKHGQEGAPVEPVVAGERGFRQLFSRGKRSLGQANLGAAGRDIIFAEPRIELVQAKAASGLGNRSWVSSRKRSTRPRNARPFASSTAARNLPAEGMLTVRESRLCRLSTGPSAMAWALFARSRIFFTSASVGVRPSASAARSRRLLIWEVKVETNSVFLSRGCRYRAGRCSNP